MRLLLVDNMILPDEGSFAHLDVHPHLGLLALAAAASADGHDVQIYDPKRLVRAGHLQYDATLYERVASELLATRPDAVGFTSLGCSFLFAVNVAAILKRVEPELPILLGGPHATMLHAEILERFPQFDVIARHECDEIIAPLLARLERRDFERIPGVSWRDAHGVRFTDGKPKVDDLDRLPLASYDLYPVAELGLELLRIEAGRGCPFHCTFCSTAGFFQRSFRLKSPERLVRELDLLHARYGFRDFKLDHDMFTVSKRKVREFCEAVRGRGYRWRASARVDCVDVPLLEAMAESGCVSLYFGIETGSPRMQELCQKRLDLDLVLPTLDACDRLGIETTASFITGYPEETAEDQEQTLDMIGRCTRPSCLTQLHMLAPEPGTPLFEQHAHELAYDGYGGPYNALPVGTDDERLVLQHPSIFQTYYYYPAAIPRAQSIAAVELVATLRRLGPIVLAYLLRAYDGRLSVLVRELRASGGDVEQYVRARFGERHHVTSLVRFALAHGALPENPQTEFDPAAEYVLDATILTELHDCAALLARIRDAEAILDDDSAGERGTYVVKGASSFVIDDGVEAIATLFERPRTCTDVAAMLREAAGATGIEPFFEELARAGIIVRAESARLAEA